MTWELIALGLFIAASGGVLVPAAALMLHREYNRRIVRMPAATEFENIEGKLTEARRDLQDAQVKIADFEQGIRAKTDEVNVLEVRRALAVAEADEAAARKLQIDDDLRQLEPKRIQLEEIERQLASKQEQLADAIHRKGEAETKIEQYLRFRERLKNELQELEEKANQAKAIAEQLPALQAELQVGQSRLEAKTQEIERAITALADRQLELAQAAARHESLKDEVRGLEQHRKDLEAEIQELTERVNQAQSIASQLPGLEAELQTLQLRLDSMKQESERTVASLADIQQDLARVKGQRDSVHDALRGLEMRRGELERLIANLDAQVQQAAKDRGDAERNALADLTRLPPCLSVAGLTNSRVAVSEEQALGEQKQYLEKLGLKFHDRTLYAFHTCLKVNDLSPLTVLAGISGTGKSELPRRYAEGMGMHFLQMAVQPRWDSPQDLFGFYNYLEHRYIATDLARALAHLDQHNHPELAGPWQDRILLVLLDEMNLARVEYYFSEFLSRLEVRKSVVAEDSSKRLAAEVQLDIGGREKPFNLYVDRNVLFVGTMNEDESTQTLSDKVIDRANVLRFGRPLKLAETQPGQAIQVERDYLSRQTCNNWLRSVDDLHAQDRERLRDWIGDLNKAMEGLERPFGHRVNQAVLLYCANYPDQGPQRLSNAFVDQLEQRILPKLRGIDTAEFSDSLGQLQTLIENKVGDDLLAKAIEDWRKKPLFNPQGLIRQD